MNSTPGVSIEELFSLSLSVSSSATAVPVMIGKFVKPDGTLVPVSDGCVKVVDWLDYQSKFGIPDLKPGEVTVTSSSLNITNPKATEKGVRQKKSHATNENGDSLYTYEFSVEKSLGYSEYQLGVFSLMHYFENGGGPCYVLSYTASGDYDKFSSEIKKHPEITLIVLAENSSDEGRIYAKLNGLLEKDKGEGYFLIAHGDNGVDPPVGRPDTGTNPEQTAYYYPRLGVPYKLPSLAESVLGQIAVTGYVDDENDVNNLSELKNINPDLHAQITAAIKKQYAEFQLILPPSPAVAGAYCRTDRERGVWKAAANITLRSVVSLEDVVSDARQSDMNKNGINVIRQFSGQGVVIWGARTLVNEATPDWLYVPVRRLFNAAQRDISAAMRFAVFEPNSPPTWERVRAAIDNYLHDLWQRGALLGTTPEEAYFVQVGKDITMTDTDIKQGRMIVKVGMAAVRPAEFIILQFTQEMEQS
ncbi:MULTISPECIES: phage tail sheath C-terminal domain-containing protein [unclassified Burkholderia]|uniref:phage tail sheath family protein n=1 Tax=unclassified Burkholderia TaxID=2613784 RepID=UPI0009EB0FFA|nr:MULTISPECIES: phage tail sheath C-terminal domain-containing protein [unclassified Burkholderia]